MTDLTKRVDVRSVEAAGLPRAEAPFTYCLLLLVASAFLQKIAIPGSNGMLALSVLALTGAGALGLVAGHLRISTLALATYLAFLVVMITSYMSSVSPRLSFGSFALLAIVQFPLTLRFAPGVLNYHRLLDVANRGLLLIALCGIVQFAGQFVGGRDVVYALDLHLPESLFLGDFNRMNPLYYGSPYFKSNGFFLAEPSFFSQYVGIGVIIELMTYRRTRWLLIYAAALICSFSGTGLIMLGVFLPFYLVRRGGPLLLVAALATVVVVVAGAGAIGLDFFVDRASEFARPGTSGHARFVSPFLYLTDVVARDPATLLIGRGPGTIKEYFSDFAYEAFDPTWAKIVYEYGFLGAATYLAFLWAALRTVQPRFLKAPLVVLYALLGGYAQNAFVVSLLVVFLSWTAWQPLVVTAHPARAFRHRSPHGPAKPSGGGARRTG